MILTITVSPSFFENSFAQQMSPHQQWKKFADIDMMTCTSGHLLIQKSNGNPACVMPSTYLKLVDRGYGIHNQSMMYKHPEMMNQLMKGMVSNEKIMSHWHEMIQNDPNMMMQSMDDWVSQMKNNPELLKNMLAPMTSDPELREKMIETMKNHSHMENSLKMNSKWMDSVHHQMMNSGMGQGMHSTTCTWCPDSSMNTSHGHSKGFVNSDRMMNMMHDMWINPKMSQDMHLMMLQNPSHMEMMSQQMMEPMLGAIMDDDDLRQEMIDLMLEHKEFMNTIRHDNSESK